MEQNKHFSPLHVHTEYSLLDGALKIKDYYEFAKKEGWKSVAITDHGNVFGAIKFFQQAKKAGIKAILGCEMYFTPDHTEKVSVEKKYYHLTILVQNEVGYSNLCRLSAFSYQKGFYFKPRIDFKILEENSEGLIILSGCVGGYIGQLILEDRFDEAANTAKWFQRVFPERYFFELQPDIYHEDQRTVNAHLLKLGKELGIDCVATPDAHYLKPEHNMAHEVMLSIGTKNLLSDPDRYTFGEFRGHLKTTQEMLSFFQGNEEVVWNSGKIADMCQFEFKFGTLMFPQFEVPEGHTQETYFEKICWDGLDRIFEQGLVASELRTKYNERLEIETALIKKMGFVGYFLVVSDFIAWAKEQKIPVGPGRGSAAGSLAAWCMQITNVDPLAYNLLFERFLNPERVSLPDVDIDFCIQGREVVIDYVKEKYGRDCVCQIITFGTMAAKGVVKDVARTLGLSFQDSQVITDLIPEQLKITLKEAIEQEPLLAKMIQENPKIKELFDICFVLEGTTRHASKHAAGIVISPKPLQDVIPLYIPPKTTDLVTQYDMTVLEDVGFLKMDFLGLKNLTVIDNAVRQVKKRYGIEINLDKLRIDDEKTFELLGKGKTNGIFQFEGSGVTDVMTKLKPSKFEDLIAVNALYRPGPLGSGMVDDFIDGRHGRKEPVYMFEELRPVLEETYGVIVYQEQVMKIASVIGGYTLGGADLLRRAMGKKKPEEMAKQKSIFLAGAEQKGFNLEKADRLFELMAYFAGYGFNKYHYTAYALIAYQTAYLKTHYPKEFISAMLTFETSDPDKLQEYLQNAKEVDVKIFPPDINRSEIEFIAIDEGVLYGFQGIKNVGDACLKEIIEQRNKGPFTSLYDFCKRINLRVANKRVLENFIYSGAMDNLPGSRAQKIAKLDAIIAKAAAEKEAEKSGQTNLFNFSSAGSKTMSNDNAAPTFDDIPDFKLSFKLEKEKEVLGLYLSAHPLAEYKFLVDLLQKSSLYPKDFNEVLNKKVCFIGLVLSSKNISTKAGKKMAFVNLEDYFGTKIEGIVFPMLFEKLEDAVNIGSWGSVLISGVCEKAGELIKVKIETITPCHKMFNDKSLKLNFSVDVGQSIDYETVCELSQIFSEGGTAHLKIKFKENASFLCLETQTPKTVDFLKLENAVMQQKINVEIGL